MTRCLSVVVAASAAASVLCAGPHQAHSQTYQFNYSGAITNWTVPTSGIYRITAQGAAGGARTGTVGGRGAIIAGELIITEGTTLQIAVGGKGGISTNIFFPQNPPVGGGGAGAAAAARRRDEPAVTDSAVDGRRPAADPQRQRLGRLRQSRRHAGLRDAVGHSAPRTTPRFGAGRR